ncbi:MAG: glycosyltransferase family 39 protein [Phycisphaerales bacterium]
MSQARRAIRILPAVTVSVAFIALAIRMLAPSDLWDQTQPRTIAYTADMLSRGGSAWILARDVLAFPATKPPLYNWLAAPFVELFGRGSEIAHKAPSILAAAAIVALLVRIGNRVASSAGWLAALAWIACYATIKLGYLARPDMLLCLILFVGWLSVVRSLEPSVARTTREGAAPPAPGIANALIFWSCVVLAAWTKGPVAVVLPTFAVVASLALHRSLRPLRSLRPAWGLPCALVLAPAWYGLVAIIDRDHLINSLWKDEIYGRVTGTGPEGGHRGIEGIVHGLPYMTLYFFTRFLPWSIASALGIAALLDRRDNGGLAKWRTEPEGSTLLLASLWVVLLLVIFSVSSGKRADYISPAFPPAALVAAWWMMRDRLSPVRAAPWIAPVAAAVTVAGIGYYAWIGPVYSTDTTRRFDEVTSRLRATPRDLPLVVVAPNLAHWAILESSFAPSENTMQTALALVESGQAVRVLVADPDALAIAQARSDEGHGEVLWSIEQTDEAKRFGYASPVYLFELRPAMLVEDHQSSNRHPAS